ncbi:MULTISPECIES: hypothetical protein [Morganellaceae]|uniref:hypothetical protein n=1 Tax=Morganellaceae TaxID=1903414 RepID=UPI001121F856|nr:MULTISPECIES: hypothetical protein [Providencia]TNU98329.1 hypothetical protein FH869_19655 [Providencia rettgeri]WOB88788.1 hypothetical protein P3L40_22990 [Providencia sp. PROV040]
MADWDEIFNLTKSLFGIKDNTFSDYSSRSRDKNKLDSFKSELLFAYIFKTLQEIEPSIVKLICQSGENHPDLKLTIDGLMAHVEITKITKPENRFRDEHYCSLVPEDVLIQDEPKLHITSKITDKSKQYGKWLAKGIVDSNDSKIIAIDMGDLFPGTVSGPLLFAAYAFFKEELELVFDKKTGRQIGGGLPIARNEMKKKKNTDEGEKLVPIKHDDLLDGIISSSINGIIAYHRGTPASLHIININNDPLMELLYQKVSGFPGWKTEIIRHGILS